MAGRGGDGGGGKADVCGRAASNWVIQPQVRGGQVLTGPVGVVRVASSHRCHAVCDEP